MSKTRRRSTGDADAVFVGWQKMSSGEEFPLYNITAELHPAKGSTVSDDTLRKLNLQIPATPSPPADPAPAYNRLGRLWRKLLFGEKTHPLRPGEKE